MPHAPHVAGSTGFSDTRRSACGGTGRMKAAPKTVLDSASMPAPDDTHRNGESVTEVQPLDQRLLSHVLRNCSEQLNVALKEAFSDAKRGELDRDQYVELMGLYHELGEVLEYVDEYTYGYSQDDPERGGCSD